MKKYFLLLLSVLILCFAVNIETQAQTSVQNVSGWAWGTNIGWINFGSWPNRVRYEPSSGNLLGYAWNNNIGWIRFDPTGPYPNPQTSYSAHGVRIQPDNQITGWARACNVFQSGCSGDNLKSDIQLGGWDGWIKMSYDPSAPDTGAQYDTVLSADSNGSFIEGHAWGGDVIGWIDFYNSATHRVSIDNLNVTCEANSSTVGNNLPITWDVTTSGSSGSLTYNYTVSAGAPPLSGSGSGNQIITTSPTSPFGGVVTLDVTVTDSSSNLGRATCSVEVVPVSPTRNLSVNINGEGSVDIVGIGPNPDCVPGEVGCGATIADGTQVDLTALWNPVLNTFRGWSGDVPGCGTSSTCQFDMDQDRSVTATFWPVGYTLPANPLVLDKTIIRIDSHNSGLSARSPSVKISNQGNQVLSVCVKSVTSKIGLFPSLNGALGVIQSNTEFTPDYLARCYFDNDDDSDRTCDVSHDDGSSKTNISSIVLAPLGSLISSAPDNADFSIKIPNKLSEIKENSPYDVVIGVCGDDDSADETIEFQYQPLTFEPQ